MSLTSVFRFYVHLSHVSYKIQYTTEKIAFTTSNIHPENKMSGFYFCAENELTNGRKR